MLETPEEIDQLQALLDTSFASAGPHLISIIDPARRMPAKELVEQIQGMLDYYLPKQGPTFETWLNHSGAVGLHIRADKLFTFRSL